MKNSHRSTIRTTSILVDDLNFRTTNHTQWYIAGQTNLWRPPTDLYETAERFVIRVEIAGMDEKDFIIIVDKNFIIISGIRPDIAERRAFHQMEIHYGEFRTEVEIPGAFIPDQIHAEYEDGFLYITLLKDLSKSY